MSINELWEQVKALSQEERHELVSRLLAWQEDTTTDNRQHDILEFVGIAAHLTDDEDPQAYVNRLRDEWDADS
jgi:hypothetical protein